MGVRGQPSCFQTASNWLQYALHVVHVQLVGRVVSLFVCVCMLHAWHDLSGLLA